MVEAGRERGGTLSGDDHAVRISPRPLIVALAVAAAVMMVAGLVLWNAHTYFRGDGFVWMAIGEAGRALYIGREANVYTWYSAMVLAAVVAGLGLHTLAARAAGRAGWRYGVLAIVALMVSADEAAALHEKMGSAVRLIGVDLSWTFEWLIVGIPMAVFGGALLLWVSLGIDPVLRRRLVVAGFVFLLGAVGFEALSGIVSHALGGARVPSAVVAYQAVQLVEESLEIAGALLALWATLQSLRPHVSAGRVVVVTPSCPRSTCSSLE